MMRPDQIIEFLTQFGIPVTDYVVDNTNFRHSNSVYRLTDKTALGKPTFYFKDYSSAPDGVERAYAELAAITLLQEQTNVPVPQSRLLHVDSPGKTYLLQNELPGIPLETILASAGKQQAESMTDQSARMLFQIHKVKSKQFGSVDGRHGERYMTWRDCFNQNVNTKLTRAAETNLLTVGQIDYFRAKLEDSALDAVTFPALIHGDLEPRNVLVDFSTFVISGILDFESARFWQQDWDLTRIAATSFLERPELLDIFIRAYASIAGSTINELQDRIEFYRIFESLHFWVWGWGRSREFTDYITKDVARVTGIT